MEPKSRTLQIGCPYCGGIVLVTGEQAGHALTCPFCRGQFRAPHLTVFESGHRSADPIGAHAVESQQDASRNWRFANLFSCSPLVVNWLAWISVGAVGLVGVGVLGYTLIVKPHRIPAETAEGKVKANNLAVETDGKSGEHASQRADERVRLSEEVVADQSHARSKQHKQGIEYEKTVEEDRPPQKLSVCIRLPHRISEQELREIANEVRNNAGRRYDRLFILYYLPGMKVDAGAWASSHFMPELDVKILGSTVATESKLLEVSRVRDVIADYVGQWKKSDTPGFHYLVRIYEKDRRWFIEHRFESRECTTEEVVVFSAENQVRFVLKDRFDDYLKNLDDPEYYTIDDDGNLAICATETGVSSKNRPISFMGDETNVDVKPPRIAEIPTDASFRTTILKPSGPALSRTATGEIDNILFSISTILQDLDGARSRFHNVDALADERVGEFARLLRRRQDNLQRQLDAAKPRPAQMGIVWFSVAESVGMVTSLSLVTGESRYAEVYATINSRIPSIREELKRHTTSD